MSFSEKSLPVIVSSEEQKQVFSPAVQEMLDLGINFKIWSAFDFTRDGKTPDLSREVDYYTVENILKRDEEMRVKANDYLEQLRKSNEEAKSFTAADWENHEKLRRAAQALIKDNKRWLTKVNDLTMMVLEDFDEINKIIDNYANRREISSIKAMVQALTGVEGQDNIVYDDPYSGKPDFNMAAIKYQWELLSEADRKAYLGYYQKMINDYEADRARGIALKEKNLEIMNNWGQICQLADSKRALYKELVKLKNICNC